MTATTTNTCPVCRGYVGRQKDGTLFPHKRYIDGGGCAAGPGSHAVPCEGGWPS